ncbi:Heat shock protein 40 like protein/ DnaJ domain containing protein [Ectocarpus siliculosus]|uniref:Heat shock protein 40 like protein/ DnaJ domain containing protein n=1 Tax=Ectocarpus siliculosus TaxID=2880 RepID=D7FKC9_ECTSI|nr:Heat shock protein 40 like protein/ DnaJ domain containing protein [Ectocarpus siliculosus]|eukprot:CBJ29332.1 Heat shock protein 40 like protein/ DnaJ domain containing protein [Ectocarpus siliculosus]
MVTNHYAVMGIQDFARGSEAKRAYHRLALVWHPDRQVNASEQRKTEAEDVFKKINEAYAILSDKVRRKEFDLDLRSELLGMSGGTSKTAGVLRGVQRVGSYKGPTRRELNEVCVRQRLLPKPLSVVPALEHVQRRSPGGGIAIVRVLRLQVSRGVLPRVQQLGCLGGEEGLQIAILRLHRCVLRDIVPIVWHVGQRQGSSRRRKQLPLLRQLWLGVPRGVLPLLPPVGLLRRRQGRVHPGLQEPAVPRPPGRWQEDGRGGGGGGGGG